MKHYILLVVVLFLQTPDLPLLGGEIHGTTSQLVCGPDHESREQGSYEQNNIQYKGLKEAVRNDSLGWI